MKWRFAIVLLAVSAFCGICSEAATDPQTILILMGRHFPELSIRENKRADHIHSANSPDFTVTFSYDRKGDPANTKPAFAFQPPPPSPFLVVEIESFASEKEAQQGFSKGLLTQVAPAGKQVLKGITVYEWSDADSSRFAFQVRESVVHIEGNKAEAKPLVPKVFVYLADELQAP